MSLGVYFPTQQAIVLAARVDHVRVDVGEDATHQLVRMAAEVGQSRARFGIPNLRKLLLLLFYLSQFI